MAKLSPINIIIGFPANLNVNGMQNKFKDDVSKDMTNILPKIGQLLLCTNIDMLFTVQKKAMRAVMPGSGYVNYF